MEPAAFVTLEKSYLYNHIMILFHVRELSSSLSADFSSVIITKLHGTRADGKRLVLWNCNVEVIVDQKSSMKNRGEYERQSADK